MKIIKGNWSSDRD